MHIFINPITNIVIMNRYVKIYAWIYGVFGSHGFAIEEYRAVFPTGQAAKVLFDLVKLGYIVRLKRKTYKAICPEELIKKIAEGSQKAETILGQAGKKYAYCDNDAVKIWTEGYYWTGFTKGYKPIHARVLKSDKKYWEKFFGRDGVEFVFEDQLKNRTLFGVIYVLHLVKKLDAVIKDGVSVIPLAETVEFCRQHELAYSPALEYLNEKYKLNLFVEQENRYV